MRVTPTLHEVEFGESLTWTPPSGAARYHVWIKTDAYTWFNATEPTETTYGGNSPRWGQVAGFDVQNNVALDFPVALSVKSGAPNIKLTAAGIDVEWQISLALFDGHDPEVMMLTAMAGDAKVMSIDRYRLPTPNNTDASTIAAQERRLLQTLLNTREKVAAAGGKAKVMQTEGEGFEYMELAALDRRVAEVRARIVWFDTEAAGNALPRAEFW